MKLIVLDRDGVINQDSPNYIRHPDEWIPIDSSLRALAVLNQAGYTVVVCSNQSGIARGYYDECMLGSIHEKMHAVVSAAGGAIDQIYYCPHAPMDGCECRKPLPGLLKMIEQDYHVSLKNKVMVGDRLTDVKAALAMEMLPVLVKTGIEADHLSRDPCMRKTEIAEDLYQAVQSLLGKH